MSTDNDFCQLGLAVIETEAAAINTLKNQIDEQFAHACRLLLDCQGRIVVTGMGKSGHIASKIAATLASTGSPAFYVHPGEASHGDMGMITRQDVVLALSNSGKTNELLQILPLIKRLNIPLISLTGNSLSPLAQDADVHLDVSVEKEACPLGLAPTASTTAALVMGDALAVALLQARGFTEKDFALSHPGGNLGKRLLLRVGDLTVKNTGLPIISDQVTIKQALDNMTEKALGMTLIVDAEKKLLGIYTDGDVRRTLEKDIDIHKTLIREVMTPNCKTIFNDTLAAEALTIMEQFKITALPIVDEQQKPVGVIHLHHLLKAGVI